MTGQHRPSPTRHDLGKCGMDRRDGAGRAERGCCLVEQSLVEIEGDVPAHGTDASTILDFGSVLARGGCGWQSGGSESGARQIGIEGERSRDPVARREGEGDAVHQARAAPDPAENC